MSITIMVGDIVKPSSTTIKNWGDKELIVSLIKTGTYMDIISAVDSSGKPYLGGYDCFDFVRRGEK